LNYRHAFHAGNFADLVKHAALLQLLADGGGGPVTVVDTHAGRGLYDLAGPEARRSGEAEAGVLRLMAAADAPPAFGPLVAQVRALNPSGVVRRYPGSPWLIAEAIADRDHYLACELRPDEHGALRELLKARRNVETRCVDGYAAAAVAAPANGRLLVLIDPPFERPDDYHRIGETLAAVRDRNPHAQALVWLPLKDLETFDGFLRELDDALQTPMLVGEARMRPLSDPMRMNGCALVLLGAPDRMAAQLEAICGWTATVLGDRGQGRVYTT
jgi:23S rRNA (adenine2030-N6)-methyltransferase